MAYVNVHVKLVHLADIKTNKLYQQKVKYQTNNSVETERFTSLLLSSEINIVSKFTHITFKQMLYPCISTIGFKDSAKDLTRYLFKNSKEISFQHLEFTSKFVSQNKIILCFQLVSKMAKNVHACKVFLSVIQYFLHPHVC